MSYLKRLYQIICTIGEFSKLYIVLTILIKIFNLCNLYLMLFLNRLIINDLSNLIILADTGISSIIVKLAIYILIEIITTLLFNYLQYRLGKLKLLYDDNMAIKLTRSISNLDMTYYDDPEAYNQTRQAGRFKSAILDNYNCLIDLVITLVSFFIAIILALRFNIVITILSIISTIPGLVVRRNLKLEQYTMENNIMTSQRFTDYLLGVFSNRNVEMEMQLYGFQDFIFNKAIQNQAELRDIRIKYSLKNAKSEALLMVIGRLLYFIQQIIMIITIIRKKLTIGDYSYYGGIIGNLSSSVNSLVEIVNSIHINDIKYNEYLKIIDRSPKIDMKGNVDTKHMDNFDIEFKHVSFKYPNSNEYCLRDVSFIIKAGTNVAIVGKNGAGKSTIIKLLLRFYDPTEGEILLNGVNIKEYDLKEYRKMFSTMFQDIILYLLSIHDNIIISDVDIGADETDERINRILCDLDISVINGEEIDLKRFYGKEFNLDGYVLSKGQQQRLHAARTLFHKGEFYILDEPSASMDAISEYNFLQTLSKYTAHKTVIYITHKYNNLDKMDNILVFDNGVLVESGKHQTLVDENGVYAQMYILQNENLEGDNNI